MAPETEARQALMTMLAGSFDAASFPVVADKLHGSVGRNGNRIGVYPDRTVSWAKNVQVSEMQLVVQFYGKYDLRVDPDQVVDPAIIEGYADTFRNAMRTQNPDPNTSSVWYFTLNDITYPPDPTGNISRFEAHLTAYGNNGSQLSETSG